MRTYKTWEVIKMLSENPNLRFKKSESYGEISDYLYVLCGYIRFERIDGNGGRVSKQISGGQFEGNVSIENTWQLVETPVTWQEALQAWAEEKTVICKFNDINEEYSEICFSNDYDTHLTRYQILYGQWFIVPEEVDE